MLSWIIRATLGGLQSTGKLVFGLRSLPLVASLFFRTMPYTGAQAFALKDMGATKGLRPKTQDPRPSLQLPAAFDYDPTQLFP
jgi:hypothetical protein